MQPASRCICFNHGDSAYGDFLELIACSDSHGDGAKILHLAIKMVTLARVCKTPEIYDRRNLIVDFIQHKCFGRTPYKRKRPQRQVEPWSDLLVYRFETELLPA